jgi:hypothetical protein
MEELICKILGHKKVAENILVHPLATEWHFEWYCQRCGGMPYKPTEI